MKMNFSEVIAHSVITMRRCNAISIRIYHDQLFSNGNDSDNFVIVAVHHFAFRSEFRLGFNFVNAQCSTANALAIRALWHRTMLIS